VNLSAPLTDVSPSLHGAVLTVLAQASAQGQALSGRRVAARIRDRGSQEGVRRVLKALATAGLVHRVAQPPAALYTLNTEHLAVPHLLAAHNLREELFARMREFIGTWEIQPVSAVVFGSVARGDSDAGSEIELLLVRRPDVAYSGGVWARQVRDLIARVDRWAGSSLGLLDYTTDDWAHNYFGLVDYTAQDWSHSLAIRDPFLDQIERDGVTLAGLAPPALRRQFASGDRLDGAA